ncbi:MAG: YceI family protein [Croceibacterium sp.]
MTNRNTRALAAPAALALALAALSLATPGGGAVAQNSTAPAWTIQPGGTLGFTVMNNGSERLAGEFGGWTGDIRFDPLAPGTAAIAMEIDLASATLNDGFRDQLLKGDEFFDVSAGPTATFTSDSVEALPDGRFVAHGTLALRGVSQPQDVEFRLTGGDNAKRVEGSATIERKPFNIGFGQYGGSLAPSVAVEFAFDAARE